MDKTVQKILISIIILCVLREHLPGTWWPLGLCLIFPGPTMTGLGTLSLFGRGSIVLHIQLKIFVESSCVFGSLGSFLFFLSHDQMSFSHPFPQLMSN